MLNIFRHLRKSFFATKKTKNYLLYAIGEIGLVVIGILIALQINNWNEKWHEKKLANSTLIELRFDLKKDTSLISENIRKMQNSMISINHLIEHVETKNPYDTSLNRLFMMSYTAHSPTFGKYNSAAFDLLKGRGPDIIDNSELRRKIVEYYTITYSENEGWFMNLKNVWNLQSNRLYDNFIIKVDSSDKVIMYPDDYEYLLENQNLMYPFHHYNSLMYNGIKRLISFRSETTEVLELIENELKNNEIFIDKN